MIYSRIKYDIFFKKVFSQEHILKAFLNTVLAGELPAPIVKLTYQPTDFITKSERQYLNAVKHTVIDVFITTETGARALVEIQKGTTKADLLRFVDYQCRNFSNQFRVGDDYAQYVPCYSVGWLFDMTPPHRQVKEKIRMQSDQALTDWRVNWEIIAIYPRCINEEHLQRHSLEALEEWLLLDVVADRAKSSQIKDLIHTQEVQEAFEQLDISGLTDEEIEELEFEEAIDDRYKLSFEKRMRQARQETERERNREIALKLLISGIPIETIQEATSLTIEEIEQVRATLAQ